MASTEAPVKACRSPAPAPRGSDIAGSVGFRIRIFISTSHRFRLQPGFEKHWLRNTGRETWGHERLTYAWKILSLPMFAGQIQFAHWFTQQFLDCLVSVYYKFQLTTKLNNLDPSLSLAMQFWIPKINIWLVNSLYAVSTQCIYWTPLKQCFSNFSMNRNHLE